MAPEQIAGKEVTPRSDIYALGLVLYELFTGQRALDAANLAELIAKREQAAITPPSAIVRDLDPSIERVILRCLEADPTQRPGSALAVAAALPGGDPLAAALAAGETPSPEMVAAAGRTEAVATRVVVAHLAWIVLSLVVVVALVSAHPDGQPRQPAEVAGGAAGSRRGDRWPSSDIRPVRGRLRAAWDSTSTGRATSTPRTTSLADGRCSRPHAR